MKRIFIIIALFLVSSCESQSTDISIKNLIPKDSSIVDIMQISLSQRGAELSKIFKISLQKDPEWTKEYVAKHRNLKPGEPLPYHPNFGMSEEEYNEMLKLFNTMTFEKIDQEVIVIEEENNIYRITGGEKLSKLINLEIDLNEKSIKTPFGTCTDHSSVENLEGLNGIWSGFGWKLDSGDPLSGNAVNISFDLGHMSESKKSFIYYKAKKFSNGALEDRADIMIYY